MSRRVWTFVRCGINGRADGVYGEEYERAHIRRLAEMGDRAEFVHDEDMPEPLRYRGSWGMLALYNLDLKIGNDDGNIYVAGLDTVFLRDLDKMADALDAVDADVVGAPCFGDGEFNSMVLRIRRGSRGARSIWSALVNRDFNPRERCEHYFVRRACSSLGVMEHGYVESYRGHLGKFKRQRHMPAVDLDKACALVFHGPVKPHDVANNETVRLHDLVRENWGNYAY